jgi:hypothetical protein
MTTRKKSYSSFFGILCATVNRKMHSQFSSIETTINQNMPKIIKLLLSSQLKPAKQYSTNNL